MKYFIQRERKNFQNHKISQVSNYEWNLSLEGCLSKKEKMDMNPFNTQKLKNPMNLTWIEELCSQSFSENGGKEPQ